MKCDKYLLFLFFFFKVNSDFGQNIRLKTESGTTVASGHAGVGVVMICLDTS